MCAEVCRERLRLRLRRGRRASRLPGRQRATPPLEARRGARARAQPRRPRKVAADARPGGGEGIRLGPHVMRFEATAGNPMPTRLFRLYPSAYSIPPIPFHLFHSAYSIPPIPPIPFRLFHCAYSHLVGTNRKAWARAPDEGVSGAPGPESERPPRSARLDQQLQPPRALRAPRRATPRGQRAAGEQQRRDPRDAPRGRE